ncbi:MAG: class I SAM-dependent methyltransferase [Proteobacteria bacterium]|nr:class I SAM-dependent methyltransferase [Pseudomonadota bacterium]MDA1134486.1 class I SAM-dependent methyltransferase [Pseudomonadota bacterium]
MIDVKQFVSLLLRRNGKVHFLSRLKETSHILDVGCGNNSPYRIKKILPKCNYTGIDIGDYNQTKPIIADKYIITTPNEFHLEINKFSESFDAVVSSHNLEHCNDRVSTLMAMLNAVKKNGLIYLSFPCEQSTTFPKRKGTLNYFDDPTHLFFPPNFRDVINVIEANNFSITFCRQNYSPIFLKIFGFLVEPISKMRKKVLRGTLEYYGFETIIIAKKNG